MRQLFLLTLVIIFKFPTNGQVKVNNNGKFFNYNGTKIYYEDTGKGEPLLLLHNFFNTADCWEPHVKVYSKQFRTIAVDMMGHGRSDIYNKNDINFRHKDYATMILALLDSLKLYNVNAIGSSSGGTTLLFLNTMQPERFKSVISVGGHIYYSQRTREWITKTGMDRFLEITKFHGPEKQEYLAKVFWEGRNLYGEASFTPDVLSLIKAKWLVVLGDNDFVIPVELGVQLHQSIRNSRLWIVPNGGHFPHLEPAILPEFLRISLEFLNGQWEKSNQ